MNQQTEVQTDSAAREDKVNHPSHYTQGRFETIEIIRDTLTPEQFEGLLIGNVLKYVCRYRYKNGIEDLKKALWYLSKVIEEKEKQNECSDLSQ